MDNEIIQLIKENNIMLKAICHYLIRKEQSPLEDFKGFVSNIVANIATDGSNINNYGKSI